MVPAPGTLLSPRMAPGNARMNAQDSAAPLDLHAAPASPPVREAERARAEVHAVLARSLPAGPIRIYEAGGGSTSYLPADLIARAEITVVDIDPVQVANNGYAHQVFQGDIQTWRFEAPAFDLVVCYNVIEHLDDVAAAFEGFRSAVKPGGLVLIGAPHPRSLSGVVTRFTPHGFHVWFCKRILGWRTAGQPGSPPFPTVFHPLVDPQRLAAHAASLGFKVLHSRVYESPRYPEIRARLPWLGALLDAFAWTLNRVTAGDVRHGDYLMVLRAP